MRSALRQILAALLALVAASPFATAAQEAAPPADPAKAAAAALVGSWSGWAKLANDWPDLPCSYEGTADTDSVRLAITSDGGLLRGSVAIDLPAAPGSQCPALRKRYSIAEVETGTGTMAFTDSGGNEWTLSLRRSSSVLQGLLAWRMGGTDQPLAEGFATKNGAKPPARLAGEVRLRKADAAGEPAASGAAAPSGSAAAGAPSVAAGTPAAGTTAAGTTAPAPRKAGADGHVRNLGIVLGANAVGLAALYGVNKLGQGSSTVGTVTCSPRVCVVGAPNAPCLCYNEIVVGASCGDTKTGLGEGETGCDGVAKPCAANLSCNSGFCQGQDGRCPF
jgi:hypothetical protein